MTSAAGGEREAAFRADVARLVQAMHHHLPGEGSLAVSTPAEAAPLLGPVRRLAILLDEDASAEHLQEAALAVVDAYDWPCPEASGSGEGPVIDPAILAAVERLRTAMDEMDEMDEPDEPDPS